MVCGDYFRQQYCGLQNLKSMAERHVESKKTQSSPTWVWILVAVVIIGIVAYFLTRNNNASDNQNTGTSNNSTSYVAPAADVFYLNAA